MSKSRLAEGCSYDPETNSVSGWTLWQRWDGIVSGAVASWVAAKYGARKERVRALLFGDWKEVSDGVEE